MAPLIIEYITQSVNIKRNNLRRKEKKLIYKNIRDICREKGVVISQMEEVLNFPRSSICKWDENTPSVIKVKKVADYLNVPIEYFLMEEGETK